MDEATRCDRLILMRAGEIIAQDTPARLLQRTNTTNAEDAFLALIHEAEKPASGIRAPGKHRAVSEEP